MKRPALLPRLARSARAALALALVGLALAGAHAGELTREQLEARFRPPLRVADKAADVPVWPITSELQADGSPVAYAFESVDLAPIPGFEGSPINLLITLDRQGNYLGVELIRQHEPVFLSGLGEAPLREFLTQYTGHGVQRPITVSTNYGGGSRAAAPEGGKLVVLDGVSKATASVRIVNQTVLTAALKVARARLGMAPPAADSAPARVRETLFERQSVAQLLERGAIGRLRLSNREAEALFAGDDGAGLDPQALAAPDETFVELYVAYLNAPSIGRSLLGDAGFETLQRNLQPGQHAWWVASAGRDQLIDDEFVRASVPPRLSLLQDGAPVEIRDMDLGLAPLAPELATNRQLIVRAPPLSPIDPGRAVRLEFSVERARGQILPQVFRHNAVLEYAPPPELFEFPPRPLPDWLLAWRDRAGELAVITAALVLLAVVLARPRAIAASRTRLRVFRLGFLAATLVGLGWYAQGQLSVVQLTAAVKALRAGQGLASFLYDPVSLLIMAATLLSFFVWGRGTFCGWLCPFGALQEFVALAARALRLPQRRLPPRLGRALARGRYVILAALLGAAAFAPAAAERMVEIEPFKTAITVGFDRSGPYLAYTLGLLLAGAFYYKFFCRYLCPLGAAMSLGGKLRLTRWLPRRAECGKPCQTCRHACDYDAIARDGTIRYDDCFQCLDCVGIYHDAGRCAPLLLYRKKGAVVELGGKRAPRRTASTVTGA